MPATESTTQQSAWPVVAAAAAGVLLWVLASVLTSKREPWDASEYWGVVYPLSIAAAAFLAYRHPRRATVLAFAVFAGQFLGMCLLAGEVGSLWPLGLVLFSVLALPAVYVAKIAARRSGKVED